MTGRKLVSVEALAEAVVAVAKKYHFFFKNFFRKNCIWDKNDFEVKMWLGDKKRF